MNLLIIEPVSRVQVGLHGSSNVLNTASAFAVTFDTAVRYDQITVAKILAAKNGKNARAPKDAGAFLDWLNK